MRPLTLLVSIMASAVLFAQPMELSLDQAQEIALSQNRNAQISSLEVEKAKRVVKETIAIGLPQINAEGSFQNFLDIPTQVLPDFISPSVYGVLIQEGLVPEGSGGQPGLIPAKFGTDYTLSGGATLSQMIFNGSYLVGLQAARIYVNLSQVQKEQSDTEIKSAVAQAYHTALLARENTEVLRESERTLTDMLEETQAMFDVGFVEEQDVQQMQLTLNSLSNQVQNAERQEKLTHQLLSFQLGDGLDKEFALTDDLTSLTTAVDLSGVLVESKPDILAHPDMRLMDTNLQIQRLRLKEQRSQYLPTLNGFFSHSQQAARNEFNFFDSDEDWFPNTVWGLNLSLPIFSSGMKHQKVEQLKIELKEAELRQAQAKDGLELTASQARSDYLFAQDSYDTAQENLEIAKSIRDKTRIKYQEGISTSFELNQMENQFIDSQARSLQASMNLLNALTALQKAFNIL